MKKIIFLRGSQGSGKSYFIDNFSLYNLRAYTLSTDAFRLMFRSPVTNLNGGLGISQKDNKRVFAFLAERLEEKMARGEFIIVDSTLAKPSQFNQYVELIKKYRYQTFIVQFDTPLDECLVHNSYRPTYQFVKPEVIEDTWNVIHNNPIKKSGVTVISPKEFSDTVLAMPKPIDLTEYKSVVVFGDIHGCFEPLKTYFEENPFSEDNYYIFTGDYIDRGIQNKEVLEFLLSIYEKPNVVCLRGNHEEWLESYSARDLEKGLAEIKSEEFLQKTMPQIKDIDRTELRKFCRALRYTEYFKYLDREYFVSHAGVPCLPNVFTPTRELIKGAGNYGDIYEIEKSWFKNEKNKVQIHAHRNPEDKPIDNEIRNYNLCGSVEFGADFRMIIIDKNGITPKYYKNTVFAQAPEEETFADQLKASDLIRTRECSDGIVSYNFTKEAFYDKKWNALTTKARGLFMRGNDIIARGYDKFFNLEERFETSRKHLYETVKLPVDFYVKYNGFLGLISVKDNVVRTFSKSADDSDFANLFRKNFTEQIDLQNVKEIAEKYNLTNHTFIFECVDNENDPHIIEEPKRVVLLDIVENSIEPKFLQYADLVTVGQELGVKVKDLYATATTMDEFKEYLDEFTTTDDTTREGFVVVDANDFMFKIKQPYYCSWKRMRSAITRIKKNIENGDKPSKKLPLLETDEEKDFINYALKEVSYDTVLNWKSIIDARKDYLAWKNEV